MSFASAFGSSSSASEDRAEVLAWRDDLVVVVADGAGGMRGGACAADAVIEAVGGALASPGFDARSEAKWVLVLESLDRDLAARMLGETTAVVVVAGEAGVLCVSAGDSEACIVTPSRVDDLTAGQGRKRLGSGRAALAEFRRARLDGVLVVGTDGLFKYASPGSIAAASLAEGCDVAARSLVDLVRLPSGGLHDDAAVVVVRAT
jgi:serine/threonine protein phosphatase PrpC